MSEKARRRLPTARKTQKNTTFSRSAADGPKSAPSQYMPTPSTHNGPKPPRVKKGAARRRESAVDNMRGQPRESVTSLDGIAFAFRDGREPSVPCLRSTAMNSHRFTPGLVGILLLCVVLPGMSATPLPAAVIWIEGEKPVQSSMHRHPWYDRVKRECFSGGDFISNYHKDKTGEAEYDVVAAKAGAYDLWVRANPVQSSMAYQTAGGAWTAIDLGKGGVGLENVADDDKPDLRFIAWFRADKVLLKQGRNAIRFRMDSKNSNHGYLDCFVLADEPFQPRGLLKPGEIDRAVQRIAAENAGWFPFAAADDVPRNAKGLSLRHLNEKYAGEGGFIQAKGSRFVHATTGAPVRFWAVNGPPDRLRDREALGRCARMLAKYGVNLVRMHGGYFDANGDVDPTKVRHAIDVVECMKAEGIYTHFSIYFPLWFTPKPDNAWLAGYDGKQHPFAALYFNREFQRRYRAWWKALLSTPSPTTGKPLLDDPAVFGLEIINEDSYFFWTFSANNIPDPQLRILETQFGQWLKKKYGSLDQTLAEWKGLRDKRDNPAAGRMGFRPLWNMSREKTARDKDTAAFLVESQRTFYDDTQTFLRGLGFRGVVTASNWATASPQVFGPLEKYTYAVGDFIDRHGYFGCNHKGDNAAWSIRNGHTFADRSALRFEAEEPGKPKAFVHPVMDPSYDDKPSMVSETTFCRPNRYRSEAPLFYAAYGALQGSDAVVHFSLDGAEWAVKPGFFMQPWTIMSPAMMGQFPAAAMIYRKGLIAEGKLLVELNLKLADLLDLQGTPLPQDAAFDELRLKDVPQGAAIGPDNVIDPLVHFAGRTNVNFTAQRGPNRLADLRPYIDRKAQTVTSTTGELKLDYGKGLLIVNAPAAQGVCGALREAGKTALRDLSIESDLPLGQVIAVSLDGAPLAESRRILLQVMTEEKAANFRAEPVDANLRRIADIGQDPWLVKNASGTVKFTRPGAADLKVYALDHSGLPVKIVARADAISLDPATLYYLVRP
jgi:hypothetical protein